MINHNNEAVLIDFGVSALKECNKEDPTKQTVGTRQFWAPEMFERLENKNILGESTDIWALGVTLFYMMTGRYPNQDSTDLEDL